MKRLLTVFLILYSIIGYSQSKLDKVLDKTGKVFNSAVSTVDSTITKIDTSSVTRMVANKVIDGIAGLAEGLKTTADKVFAIYTYKHRFEGIVAMVLVLIVFFGSYRFIKYLINSEYEYWHIVIGIIICNILMFYKLIQKEYILKALIPEYYTIQDILETIKHF